MKIQRWFSLLAVAILVGCSAKDEMDGADSFMGKPVPIIIALDNNVASLTRATTLPTGTTAWLTGGANGMKAYTYDAGEVSTNDPLLWTSNAMTIYGYYVDNGTTTVTSATPSYTVDDSHTSFLAGVATANYSQAERESVSLTLRQQLAYLYIQISAVGNEEMGTPRLGNDMLYTSGTFINTTFDDNGYAIGGDGSGWATSGSPTTIDMKQLGSTNTYYAVLIPQKIGTSKPFLKITFDGFEVGFKLASETTFKAGCQYRMALNSVTHTLYMSNFLIEDFADADSSTSGSVPSSDVEIN